MLHIIQSERGLRAARPLIHSSDVVLLVEAAVYLANPSHYAHAMLPSCSLYALSEDVTARGIMTLISNKIQQVDFSGFVALTETHSQNATWA
ncbi:sulfurtransferase complex subunit TusB [Vibrio sp. SM6]|uniref:Sulfurtransferase complex subunit TusB n=1 Tax=Vibrio agarilyticus TaxID=2726741 RepID=A0A7X8TUP6_9VIBR|nr:sulfurtransferase complex subunit TusB [Vibrio agarilyticus]